MNDDELTAEDLRFIKLFNKGFEEVVVPRLEEIEEKVDGLKTKMDRRFSEMEQRFDTVDANFNRLEGKFDRLSDKFQDHEQRISAIEVVPAVAHALKH